MLRLAFALALVVVVGVGCGGEGKCLQPPCGVPEAECRSNADCFSTQFCNFERNTCGSSETDMGICDNRPSACDLELDRVCGCDGKFHSNRCAAEQQGVDVSSAGDCPPPAGTFACGAQVCDVQNEFCLKAQGSEEPLGCQEIPDFCQPDPTCACFESAGGGCDCVKDVGFTVSCPLDRA